MSEPNNETTGASGVELQLDGLALTVLVMDGDIGNLETLGFVQRIGGSDSTHQKLGLAQRLVHQIEQCAPQYDNSTSQTALIFEDGPQLQTALLDGTSDIFILFVGESLRGEHLTTDILNEAFSGKLDRALIIVNIAAQLSTMLTRFVESAPNIFIVAGYEAHAEDVTHELQGHLSYIIENVRSTPRVGVGMLLVDANTGKFFLRKRLKDPDSQSLGTIGGDLPKGSPIQKRLTDLIVETFGKAAPVDVGPLLSCTTMSDGFYHYIDLTFLALIDEARNPENTSDKYVMPDNRRYWHTLNEMVDLWKPKSGLFRPVSNAFQAYLRAVFSARAIDGLSSVRFPNLSDTQLNPIILPGAATNLSSIREQDILNADLWDPNPLPFFDSAQQVF